MSSRRPTGRNGKMPGLLLKRLVNRLFRLLAGFERRRSAQGGFILPTAVLLVLMLSLTAGALTYRSYTRSTQVIVERQQEVIANAATPAIDRAKAKIEYLLTRDQRPAPKVPPSDAIENLLRAKSANMLSGGSFDILNIQELGGDDLYTLDEPGLDEERIDLDRDGTLDNAWYFPSDVNGDGQIAQQNGVPVEFVVYSILVDNRNGQVTFDDDDDDKADALVVRNSPLTAQADNPCVRGNNVPDEFISGAGWSRINAIRAEKTFQVNVYAVDLTNYDPNDPSSENRLPSSTMEFQQIREASLGNPWGAWFNYDLEATPGSDFNWNGAMHTQGSIFMANQFNAYMISSSESCAYGDGASDITLGAENTDNGFKGLLVRGNADIRFGSPQGRPTVHVEDPGNIANPDVITLRDTNESVPAASRPASITSLYLDPVELFLNDRYQHVGFNAINTTTRDPDNEFPGRIRNVRDQSEVRVSLDDTFRADDRYGPKAVYDRNGGPDAEVPSGTGIGTDIPGTNTLLTDSESGLDGYWERRAVNEGTRFIVGQRLDFGNAYGWNHDPSPAGNLGDPLYPPKEDTMASPPNPGLPASRTSEHYHRRSLRDNLAAVQGMVAYKYDIPTATSPNGGITPAVCVATTAHFGTYPAIANSRTFRDRIDDPTLPMLDFLTGNGTNGWQFDPVDPDDANMGIALANLANFAGDPLGGTPSFPQEQDNEIHPFPYMAMWGDFSMLRRIEVEGDGNGSIADESTRDTAACTLALLAYNLDAIEKENNAVNSSFGTADFNGLATDLSTWATSQGIDLATTPQPLTALAGAIDVASNPERKLLLDILWHRWTVERDRENGFATGVSCDAAALVNNYSSLTAGATADTLALAVCQDRPYFPALYYIFPTATHNGDGSTGGPAQPPAEDYIARTVTDYGQNNTFTAVAPSTIAATPLAQGSFELPEFTATNTNAFAVEWGTGNTPGADTPDARPWDLVVTDADGSNPTAFSVSVLDKVVYSGRENMAVRLLDLHVRALMDADWFEGKDSNGDEHFGLTYAFREDATREDAIVRPARAGSDFAACATFNVLSRAAPNNNCYVDTQADVLNWTDPTFGTATQDRGISLKPIDYIPDPMRRPYGFRLREGVDFNRASDESSGLTFLSNNAVAIQGNFNEHTESGPPEEEFTTPSILASDASTGGTQGGAFYNDFYGRTSNNANNDFANPQADHWRPAEILGDAIYLFSNNFLDGFAEAFFMSDAADTTGGDNGPFQYAAATGSGLVSFQNANRLADSNEEVPVAAAVLREDPNAPAGTNNNAPQSPVYVDRNGEIYLSDPAGPPDTGKPGEAGTFGNDYDYYEFLDNGPRSEDYRRSNLLNADVTTINALLISGIVPSREGQIYGGLHNFPRLNESWQGRQLVISGGFFQLFFSHTSTGPFDMERWEYDDPAATTNNRNIGHYFNPRRVWGYDVGLQYATQHPVSARFVQLRSPRSEFYRELAVDDPYINKLRCAFKDGVQVDPSADPDNC